MVCPECEAVLKTNANFCTSCGHAVSSPASAELTPPAPPSAPLITASDGNGQLAPSEWSDVRVFGSAAPNEHYLGQRLQYTEGAETFDAGDLLHRATMAQLRIHVILSIIVWLIGSAFSVLVAVVLDSLDLALLCGSAVWLVAVGLLLAPFIRRQYFPLSEWKFLLDGKASSAHAVHDHIAAALIARHSPVEYRAVVFDRYGPARPYLQIRRGDYSAFVTASAFGDDLYVGWTLWWSMSWLAFRRSDPRSVWVTVLTLPWTILVDAFKGDTESFELAYVHQYDDAKALRECVHAVTRQGVEAAVGLTPFQGSGTIGSAVPSGSSPAFVRSPTYEPPR